jgi:F-type H+-transporting ATPase subunit b
LSADAAVEFGSKPREMLELPPKLGFYVWIVLFFVFATILKSLILEPTQKLLAERAKRTTGTLGEAEQLREDAAEMEAEFERRLAEARRAGSSAGDLVRREAEAAEARILEEARLDASRLVEEVRARIQAEAAQARAALRDEAAPLARMAAEKVLGRTVRA